MNSFLIVIVGLKLIFFFELVASQSPCQNMGHYNSTSNSCACFPGYSGAYCQYVDCTKQALKCGNYSRSFCLFSVVASYCPELCNNPICACGFNRCLNNGTFNASDCSCACPAGFFGTTCESTSASEPLVCPPADQYLCQNHGAFNNRTCGCDCFPGYTGQFCETLLCNVSDPPTCQGYNLTLCTLSLVNAYCPHLCGSCGGGSSSNLNGLIIPANINAMPTFPPMSTASSSSSNQTNTSAATTTAAASLSTQVAVTAALAPLLAAAKPVLIGSNNNNNNGPCEHTLICKNSGVFRNTSCTCQCFPTYRGQLCEAIDCTVADPSQCANYTQAQCALRLVYNYCPHMCGKCQTTITVSMKNNNHSISISSSSMAANKTCTYLECLGGYFSKATCSCLCYPSWSGLLCDQVNCNASVQPSLCANYTAEYCLYQQIYQYCPVLCGSCAGNSSSFIVQPPAQVTVAAAATIVGAQTTTAGVCPTLCLNGGRLDPEVPCKCQCYPGFTGSMCELLNCGRSDPNACAIVAPTPTQCAACPFACGLCKMNTMNQQINTLEMNNLAPPKAQPQPQPQQPQPQPQLRPQQLATAPGPVPAPAPASSFFTPPPLQTAACTPLKCAQGVQFNPVTCQCPCPNGFVDDVCSEYSCALGDKDSAECFGMDCSAPGSNIICPQTCFNCDNPIA